jgi:hypothetical protein
MMKIREIDCNCTRKQSIISVAMLIILWYEESVVM